jgi:class 3 adenylate cyclase/predicted ATPase
LRDLQGAVPRLAILAASRTDAKRLTASFPESLVLTPEPLEHEALLAFLSEPAPQTFHSAAAPEHLYFAGCTLDVAGRVFCDADQREVPLTRGVFALLVVFVKNSGRVLSRDQLRNAMDGGSADSYDRSIDMLVARLRRKVESNPAEPQFIVTVPGVGYKFTPDVSRGQPTTALPDSRNKGEVLGAAKVPRGERRQVTVLSCQILGFAALAAKLDPEDLDRAIDPVYAASAKTIARYGGIMVRTLGDSVLAYFGYPQAQENDASRAVRAALELSGALRKLEAAPVGNFHGKIGIATGLMLVGDMGARGAGIQGEALNLALHMERSAPADGVVIEATTRSLIGRFFECRQIDAVELQEGLEPVAAWHVMDEIAGIPRFEALRRDGMLDFVGREVEIERLKECWSKVPRGSGQLVLLTGEAGIGKSRLTVELQKRLCGEPHAGIRYSGSAHRADAPMAVLIDELQRSAGFAASDTVAQKIEKLQEEFAALGVAPAEAAPLGWALLGLPLDASAQIDPLSPKKRKERTFAALLARIEAMAARQPVFAVVEDAHWVDPPSLEFITLLAEHTNALRLLLVIVARPEFIPPWPEYSYLTTLVLPRLSHADSALLIQRTAGERRIPVAVEADIITRADGVPLFIEELTKSVLETTSNGSDVGALDSPPAGKAPIPSTLHGLLHARIDRLNRGKIVAQIGAVIGREFSFELLRLVADLDRPALLGALDQLVRSGFALRRGVPPHATYMFKHALVRDAAYDMLLRDRRRALHASVARAYETHFSETIKTQPEILAYHYHEGGMPIKALVYLIAAAELALLRSATPQALSHLARARELIDSLPATPALRREEIRFQIVLANALMPTKGHSAPETKAAAQRARLLIEQAEALGEPFEDRLLFFSVLFGIWLASYNADNRDESCEFAAQLLALAEKQRTTVPLMIGHRVMGISSLSAGDIAESRVHLDRAIALYDPAEHRALLTRFSIESGVVILVFRSLALWLLGYPQAALADAEHALQDARDIGQATTLLSALTLGSLTLVGCGSYTKADAQLHEAAVLAKEKDALFWDARGTMIQGCLLTLTGKAVEAVEKIMAGMTTYRSTGAIVFVPFFIAYSAMAYAELGQLHEARRRIGEALTAMKTTGERWCEAEIHRIAGEIALKSSRPNLAKAKAHFGRAIAVARAQQAKALELRATMGMARLWRDHGRRKEARELLAAVYGWFTEGFDTLDLREAKVLLDALAS